MIAVHELLAARRSLRGINRDLNLGYYAVRRYARGDSLDEVLVTATHRRPLLDGYKAFHYEQFHAGQRNGSELFRQIKARGFRSSLSSWSLPTLTQDLHHRPATSASSAIPAPHSRRAPLVSPAMDMPLTMEAFVKRGWASPAGSRARGHTEACALIPPG
ncbi:hypothetical protein HDA40_001974 [Hamadaea flava]|uniref:Uncharacterized protein n=1 Tax=Hamadaea flava TaxID=1742688 RepID=A0ABV8LZK7_9ACTN|nr:hypothetical protein [Hamadaea flava]MCP2323467.1 hypothetical protein [Hamadaea flava]